MPDELRQRVLRLNADLLLDRLRPDETVRLACDLLVAGIDTPAAIELAGESPTNLTLADATPLSRQLLTELGTEPIDTTQAPWIVARDIARQMVSGDLLPEVGSSSLWALWWSCDNAQEIGLILQPLESWEETTPSERDDEAIRTQMRTLAEGVIRAADERLAANVAGDSTQPSR